MKVDPGLGAVVAHLRGDGFIAYPTETIWGLGACADHPVATQALMEWKGRGEKAPMSVLVPDRSFAEKMGCRLLPAAQRLMEACWPGPLTVVVPCEADLAAGVAREDGALGLRCSPHPLARLLAEAVVAAGLGPLTSTSLNRTGEPPAEDEAAARKWVAASSEASERPLLVTAEGADAGSVDTASGALPGKILPSSVVDCTGDTPVILRDGAIPAERLRAIWSGADADV